MEISPNNWYFSVLQILLVYRKENFIERCSAILFRDVRNETSELEHPNTRKYNLNGLLNDERGIEIA